MKRFIVGLVLVLLLAVPFVSYSQGQSRLHVTVDLLDNPPNEQPIFWHGGSLEAGDWCWVEIQTYFGNGAPEAYVPVTFRVYDPTDKLWQYGHTRTGSDGVTRIKVQTAPTDPSGMWSAAVNRPGLGDSITFPVREKQ